MNKVLFFILFSVNIFASGEANFLSAKVYYLSGDGAVVLNADNSQDERIEILVSILDKDGNLATKSATGGELSTIDNDEIDSNLGAKEYSYNDISLSRDIDVNKKNTIRFVLDYTKIDIDKISKEEDKVTINVAGLKKSVIIKLKYAPAKGLIIRTSVRTIDPIISQGKDFANIMPDIDNNLSIHSAGFPGGTVGLEVPIKVYASTEIQDEATDDTTFTKGVFTRASDMNGKIVIIKALADYSGDGVANIPIGEVEAVMKNGIVDTQMLITNGLPDDSYNHHPSFVLPDYKGYHGLGIAFIAYLKEDLSISNVGTDLPSTDFKDPNKFKIIGDHNATDTVIVRSLPASDIKIGDFNKTKSFLDAMWTRPYLNYYVLDDNDSSTEQNISLTAVDRYSNPARVFSHTAKVDCEYNDENFDFRDGCGDRFDEPSNGDEISRATIVLKPKNSNTTPSGNPSEKNINTRARESKRVYTELKIQGTGALSSAKVINSVVYLGRVTTDYLSFKGYSTNLKLETVNIVAHNTDKVAIKVVASQIDVNGSRLKIKVYERSLSGSYESRDRGSSYNMSVSGCTNCSEASQIVDLQTSTPTGANDVTGGIIRISGVGEIKINPYNRSSTALRDGFVAYFFDEDSQGKLDNYVVILPSSSSSAETSSTFSSTRVGLGESIRFTLNGTAVNSGDYISLLYGGINTNANIGLSKNEPILLTSAFRNTVGDFVGNDLSISIKGYYATSGSDFTIFVNGREVDEDQIVSTNTDYKINSKEYKGISNHIKFEYEKIKTDKNTAYIHIKEFGVANHDDGDGSSKNSLLTLKDINADGKKDSTSDFKGINNIKEIVYKGKLYTNKFYLLFDEDDDLIEKDKFLNILKTADNGQERTLQAYDYRISGDGDIGDKGGYGTDPKDVWIKFGDDDAGDEVTVRIKSGYGVNTIRFTNIIGSTQSNDYYIITAEKSTPKVNLVNSEVIIKVIGNTSGETEDFVIDFTHSDKDALIDIIQVYDKKEDLEASSHSQVESKLHSEGNYYIVRTDKPGQLIIKATGIETDSRGKDISVDSTRSLRFVNFDDSKPLADVFVKGNKVEVVIEDGSLDYDRTIVEARDSEGKVIKKAVRKDDIYTIYSLPKATYQIYVYAIDAFDNVYTNTFTRTITSGEIVKEDENTTDYTEIKKDLVVKNEIQLTAEKLIKHQEYPVYGKFISYNFGARTYLNWIFQDSSNNKAYKLFGTLSSADPFGFDEITLDFTKLDSSKWWYMIKLDGLIGELDGLDKFGWVVVSSDLKTVKKVKTISKDGVLIYSSMPLRAKLENGQIIFILNN